MTATDETKLIELMVKAATATEGDGVQKMRAAVRALFEETQTTLMRTRGANEVCTWLKHAPEDFEFAAHQGFRAYLSALLANSSQNKEGIAL